MTILEPQQPNLRRPSPAHGPDIFRLRIAPLPLLFLPLLFLSLSPGGMALAQRPAIFPSTQVGKSSPPATVTVTVQTAGSLASLKAITQTLTNADFTSASGGSCAVGTVYSAGQQCTVNVVFQPQFPGLRSGAILLLDHNGALLGSALLDGRGTGSLPALSPGQIDTVAGQTKWLYEGDGGPATQSPIFLPTAIVADASGNFFLSDSQNNRIRRVDATTGLIATIAGTGTPGYNGDQIPALQAMVSTPAGLVLDGAGNLYIADNGNQVIRRVDAITGIITTVAGSPGVDGFSGDGGLATQARLSFPESIAFDPAGNLLIADSGNNVVRLVDAVTGKIRTIAGTGLAGYNGDNRSALTAQLNAPWGLAIALDGSLLIADSGNQLVRRVDATTGVITTIAGSGAQGFTGDGGAPTSAQLSVPAAITVDPAGDLYIADAGNNRVRQINAATNLIHTIAGTESEHFAGDSGPANLAGLYGPNALFLDAHGNLFISDMFHNRIRRINAVQTNLLYLTIKVGKISPPQNVVLANLGNAPLTLSAPAFLNAATDPSTTTCATGAIILPSATCNLGAEFAPAVLGNPVQGTITLPSNAIYTAPVINLFGEVISITPTTLALISSTNPSLVAQAITYTATVSNGGTPLSGSIAFMDGASQLCNVVLGGYTATCTTAALTLGQHSITAMYSGDDNDASSVSAPLLQVVKQSAVVALTATPNPSAVTANVTLSATVAVPTGMPSGAVAFLDGSFNLGSIALTSTGTATFSTTQLSAGTHTLTAAYQGDTSNAAATSSPVTEVVNQADTATTLSSNHLTANVAQPVAFTAQVTSLNGPPATGTVQFKDGATSLGSATLSSSGVGSLATSSLAPGNHPIVAVYSGDTNDAPSTSAPILQVIQQISTSTTLTSDANPVSAGATLHLSATVTASGAGALTGSVTFNDGAISLGTFALDASGHAFLSLNTLLVGSHTLTATFTGVTNYAPSTSAPLIEVVHSTVASITLTSPAPTTFAGQPATFTATAASTTGTPTGNVSFLDSGVTLGQAQLSAQGVATFATSTLAVGSHTLTAAYAGDGQYNSVTSTALAHAIVLATPTLVLAGPATPVDAGTTFLMTAALNSTGASPTGTLTLRDGANIIATQTISGNNTYTLPNLSLPVGTHQLTASYAGDADNAAATSAPIALVIQLAPTATALTSSANPSTLAQNLTLTAVITSASPNPIGTVTFTDGPNTLGTATLVNGSASLSTSTLTLGAHAITATYAGDTNHAASTSPAFSQQIVLPDAPTLSSSVNPSASGQAVLFTLKLAGTGALPPSGPVVFQDGPIVLTSIPLDVTGSASLSIATLAVGSHPITATYAGDAHYAAATASLIQTVQVATTQVALSASANPATYASPVTLLATVTANGGIASGVVNFTDAGTLLGSASLNPAGIASFTTAALLPGSHPIVANYLGNGNQNASTSTPLTLVVKQTTTVALTSDANPSPTLSPITLTATLTNSGAAQSTGSITFTDAGISVGTAPLLNGVATLLVPSMTAGGHPMQASYTGDADDFPSLSPALIESIQLRPTTTTLTASSTNPSSPLDITLIAVVRWTGPLAPTGTMTFTSGAITLGSGPIDATGVATLTVILPSAGESITATYSGNASYSGSSSLSALITGGVPTQFTMQLNPSSLTLPSKQHTTSTLTLTSLSGFADTMQLGCLGLPFSATCTFSKDLVAQGQLKLTANGAATILLTVDTGDPLGAGAAASLHPSPSSSVLLCSLPCLLVLGLTLRRRRLPLASLLTLALLAAAILNTTGCSGLTINGTPPGTYTFKVTAAGANTGITGSQIMTLTVTQ